MIDALHRLTINTLLLILFCATATAAEIPQYESRVVESITITAQHLAAGASFDSQAVLSRIKTKQGELFSQSDFDHDLKTLSLEFDRVEPQLEVVGGQLHIALKIWPKPNIRSISWIGNEKVKTKSLQKELGITTNTVFERRAFNTAFHNLKAFYIKKGYFEAELEYKVRYDSLSSNVDIDININEGRSGRVKEIKFVNFTKREEKSLLGQMLTKRYKLLTSWASGEGTYQEEMMQQDQLLILDFLQNIGYADARVTINVREVKQSNRIVVEITADKGQHYTFGDITFSGNKIYEDTSVDNFIKLKKGQTFSPERLRATATTIQNAYGRQGFIDAYVSFEPSLDPQEPEYDVHFIIEEGAQYRIGMINVLGNTCTQMSVILHETLLLPGETFDIDKLKQTEERLKAIGYFENVNVYAVRSDDAAEDGTSFRDVIIEVEETGTGNFSAFFGFSTAENIFGGASITERNFNYKGLGCVFSDGLCALRGGGEYVHLTATIGKRHSSYVLSWTKPYFCDTPWVVGFEVDRSANRITSERYDIHGIGFALFAKYPINQFVRFGTRYRIRNTDVTAPADASPRLLREAQNSGLISAASLSLMYDSTNSLHRPTQGFRSGLEVEYAGLGGTHTFFSFSYINTYYLQASQNGVMKIRGDARFINPVGDSTLQTLPIAERLFLGGETTVRGFRPYGIGPQFPEGDPSGGLSQTLFSTEYDHCVFRGSSVFAFFDAGSLSADHFDINTIRSSWGYGVRLSILANGPPLLLGMGYPINAASDGDVKRFFMSVGGRF